MSRIPTLLPRAYSHPTIWAQVSGLTTDPIIGPNPCTLHPIHCIYPYPPPALVDAEQVVTLVVLLVIVVGMPESLPSVSTGITLPRTDRSRRLVRSAIHQHLGAILGSPRRQTVSPSARVRVI